MSFEQRAAALAALEKLKSVSPKAYAAALEQGRRKTQKAAIFASFHDGQRRAYELLRSGTYLSICAGRRGGKTYFDAAVIAESLIDSGKGEWTVYLAPTAQVGKELIWSELLTLNETHKLGWDFREHPVPMLTTSTGAVFKIVGCDDKAQLGKLRGKKYRLVVIDEAKEVTEHLRELTTEVFGPAFIGVGGKLLVTGTPGRVCDKSDFWFAICHSHANGKPLVPGWRTVHFTLRDNPWVQDPEAELAKVRADNEWTEDNVIYLREYGGIWCSDDGERVYAYLESRNSLQGLPKHYDRDTWTHVLGCDFGYDPDPCAWVVWACHPNERDVYAVHAEKHQKLTSDEAAGVTARLVQTFGPSAIVGDAGGLGKPYVEDFNRRHGKALKAWIEPAEKQGKRDHIEILNGELKAPGSVPGKGRVIVCLPMASELAHEWANLGWKDSRREVEHPSQPNHCADGGLYAFRKLRTYWNKPAPQPLTTDEAASAALKERLRKAGERKRQGFFGRS